MGQERVQSIEEARNGLTKTIAIGTDLQFDGDLPGSIGHLGNVIEMAENAIVLALVERGRSFRINQDYKNAGIDLEKAFELAFDRQEMNGMANARVEQSALSRSMLKDPKHSQSVHILARSYTNHALQLIGIDSLPVKTMTKVNVFFESSQLEFEDNHPPEAFDSLCLAEMHCRELLAFDRNYNRLIINSKLAEILALKGTVQHKIGQENDTANTLIEAHALYVAIGNIYASEYNPKRAGIFQNMEDKIWKCIEAI